MIGAIAGDIIGSVFEGESVGTTHFDLFSQYSKFTDDTVLTVAVADCILNNKDYAKAFREYGRKYPGGYGWNFTDWLKSDDMGPYNSYGNGSAMRVSPVGFAFNGTKEVSEAARITAEVTHNHPEGIKGAQAVAVAIYLARMGKSKSEIKEHIMNYYGYNLDKTYEEVCINDGFDVTCQVTVPPAIVVFLESENFEDAVRKAVSLGGDTDTLACIAGGIAEAFYKDIPEYIVKEVRKRLPDEFLNIIDEFSIGKKT